MTIKDTTPTHGASVAQRDELAVERSREEQELAGASVEVASFGLTTPGGPTARKRKAFVVYFAIGWLSVIVCAALLADFLPLRDPNGIPQTTEALEQHPFLQNVGVRADFLGTDDLGRSNLSRLVYGARVSLAIGLLSALGAMTFGLLIGIAGAFFGGAIDWLVMLYINTMQAFPALVLLLALAAILKPSVGTLSLMLAFLAIPTFARVTRANALAVRNRDYVDAARALGASRTRLIWREVFPVVFRAVLSYTFIVAAALIVAEASLSFLGLGIQPPNPSWGGMIANGQLKTSQDPKNFYLVLVPAIAFFFTVFSMNALGDWGRERMSRRTSL